MQDFRAGVCWNPQELFGPKFPHVVVWVLKHLNTGLCTHSLAAVSSEASTHNTPLHPLTWMISLVRVHSFAFWVRTNRYVSDLRISQSTQSCTLAGVLEVPHTLAWQAMDHHSHLEHILFLFLLEHTGLLWTQNTCLLGTWNNGNWGRSSTCILDLISMPTQHPQP